MLVTVRLLFQVRKKNNGFEDINFKKALLIKIQFGCLDMSAGSVLA